ncbi:Ca2+-binding EF-hand superfamily protein [Rhodovulum imhoffii]|uniref:Ca2+-binding EF-hand superfamily protein n=1 Tax=Rhodovulum imhoffii TaxID=365340 RepID=A0A2T5BQY8_9RHOB|nr:EF-hand domain-containing protein [Rhodovulum imhoffii]PTN01640.1 Ca2+-binding EF-hand superfamily protein [Rhodovulum imhoffii]
MKRSIFTMTLSAVAVGTVLIASVGAAQAWGRGDAQVFDALDSDRNGAISLEEFRAPRDARFKAMDKDGDGSLSVEELQSNRGWQGDGWRGQGRGMRGCGGGCVGPMMGAMGAMGAGNGLTDAQLAQRAETMMQVLDQDGNGQLSIAELSVRPGPEMMFNQLDADGDGSVTREEFEKGMPMRGPRLWQN